MNAIRLVQQGDIGRETKVRGLQELKPLKVLRFSRDRMSIGCGGSEGVTTVKMPKAMWNSRRRQRRRECGEPKKAYFLTFMVIFAPF